MAAALWRSLARRKPFPTANHATNPGRSLARVLTTWDLTALGVGSTLGVGVYVLAGDVARRQAGPAVLLSFVVAGIASGLAGLCYAEFGARVPLAGSAYIYSYVSVGELLAFVIGWSLVLEYAIGSASVARALTSYVDQLTGHFLERTFQRLLPVDVPILASYADPVSFAVAFGLAVILAFGVRESLSLNNIFAGLNMAVIVFVVVAGGFKADPQNWNISPRDVPSGNGYHVGDGGFMPFGISGVLRGAATCFYGFVGFDSIAASGEEVRRPQKAIPVAILGSLFIVCLSYLAVAAVLTLMWPYYGLVNNGAPLAYVFRQVGWPIAQWVVAIGGIFGLITSLFGTMYPLPRVIYAMATDGLIFRFLGNVNPRFQTPFVGTLLSGLLTGIMAALFHLQQLVDMLSIGTLMAYTLVASCVLVLRYRATEDDETFALLSEQVPVAPTCCKIFKQLVNSQGLKFPTILTSSIVTVSILLYCILSTILAVLLVHGERGIIPLGVVASFMTLLLIFITLQPSTIKSIPFKVPLVPILPALSITMNIYLMLLLDRPTWIRFSVWMVVGCLLWLVYIACRCCITEVKPIEDSSYVNAGFDEVDSESVLQNGTLNYDTPDSAGDFVIINVKTDIPLETTETHNGLVSPSDTYNHLESTPETISRRVNRFVRPTSVIQGELSMESVSDLTLKGDAQSDNVVKRGRFVRSTSIQEGRLSFEYASESDVVSIDGDTHSLYPEVFICLPLEEATKQQKVIEEESDEGQDAGSLKDCSSTESIDSRVDGSNVTSERYGDDGRSDSPHVQSDDETSSVSVTDYLSDFSGSDRKSSDRDGLGLESDGQQPVSIKTKPDSVAVMDRSSLRENDEELSHNGEILRQEHSPDTQQCLSKTEHERIASENLATGNSDSKNNFVDAIHLEFKVGKENEETILKYGNDELNTNEHEEEISVPTISSQNATTTPPENKVSERAKAHLNSLNGPNPPAQRITEKSLRSLPNFSISSFDNKPIDIDTNRRKNKSPGLKNAMVAGSFSDSSFVELLNDVIGHRSGSSSSSSGLKRDQSVGTSSKKVQNDDFDDDVFISAREVPSKEVIRERLEFLLSNGPSRTTTTNVGPEPRPQTRKAAEESETSKVEEQSEPPTEGDLNPETSFEEKLNTIMKRRTGSLPPIKKKDKEDVLLAGHTLPERRGLKERFSANAEDVSSKKEIRRRLELLFLNDPKRGVTPPVEEISTVL